jgi:translation initiation factor 2 alpha subunit (eIF-2alpha)
MQEDELVLCVVEKVTNTVTFVRLPDGREGTIISSEIAPGRIKFMRQYVFPDKRIVCKVLKDTNDHVHLSLRRVNAKERDEVMQKFKQEQAMGHALKQIFGKDAEKIRGKILGQFKDFSSFITAVREDETLLGAYVPLEKLDDLKRIVHKRRKSYELKRHIHLTCLEDDGVLRIKKVLAIQDKDVNITYLAAGEFSLCITVEDLKEGKKKAMELEERITQEAKKYSCELTITEGL